MPCGAREHRVRNRNARCGVVDRLNGHASRDPPDQRQLERLHRGNGQGRVWNGVGTIAVDDLRDETGGLAGHAVWQFHDFDGAGAVGETPDEAPLF